MRQNVRGAYYAPVHDRAQDWDWLAKWQPNVIRLMLHGSHSDPASVDVNRIRRVHETCPDALILLRVWDVDDRNFEAHEAMVADPHREADKQLDWWANVINRAHAQNIPRNQLMAGLNNETGPEKDAALYTYTEWALKYATKHGIRVGAFVFSVGRPSLAGESQYDMPYFERLLPLFLAGDHAMLLHEYMQPEGMYAVWRDDQGNERKDYTYLIGRHERWNMPGVKKIIAEWGIDGILYNRHPHPEFGNSGWRHFRDEWSPDRYADEYVECIRQADDSVIGICPFLSDYPDRKWASFDLLDAYPQFIARKDLCVKDVTQATTPPHTTHLPQIGDGPTPPAKPHFVAVVSGANIRVSPITGDVLTAVPYGAQLDVLGTDDSGDAPWARVRYAGVTGWMLASLLSDKSPTPQPTPTPVPVGDNFERCLAFILRWEGGWADDPNDPGGATMKGITLGTYTRWREAHGQPPPTKDDLRAISDAEVAQIYREWYWLKSGAHELPWPLCLAQMDTAVNAGVGKALEMLAKSGDNFLAYMGHVITWYAGIKNFEHFGRAWTRRRAEILLEASK